MRSFVGARFGALLSFIALVAACAAAPAFAQSIVAPSPDIGSLIAQAFAVFANFRAGAILVGFAVLVNLATNISKLPSLADKIAPAWRPVIALALGISSAVIGGLVSGAGLQQALSVGIPAGIAAGGGSVALHEAWQTIKALIAKLSTASARGSARLAVLLVVSGVLVAGCAALTAAERASPDCAGIGSTLGDLAKSIETIISDATREDWLAAASQAITDRGIDGKAAQCVFEEVENLIKYPHGGEPAFVPDAGTPSALERALAMKPEQAAALERLQQLRQSPPKK